MPWFNHYPIWPRLQCVLQSDSLRGPAKVAPDRRLGTFPPGLHRWSGQAVTSTRLWPYYSTPAGERSIAISLSVWVSGPKILCADLLWLWLGPLLAALRYVMYFRLNDDFTFGRSGPYGESCDTGAESDVYECLVASLHSSTLRTFWTQTDLKCVWYLHRRTNWQSNVYTVSYRDTYIFEWLH